MREPEDKVTVVNTDGGGGSAGVIAGVLVAVAAVVVILFLFGGDIFSSGQSRNIDVTIDTPDISVDAPQAPAVEAPAAE